MMLRRRPIGKLKPQNTKVVKEAEKIVNRVAAVQQERYYNAFVVNGYDCLIYNKLQHGLRCTCGSGDVAYKPATALEFDGQGNATQESLIKIFEGELPTSEPAIKIGDYTSEKNPDFDSDNMLRLTPEIEKVASHLSGTTQDPSFEVVYPEEFSEGDDDFEYEDDIGQFSNVTCGICYGNGFETGYSLYQGARYTYTPQYKQKALSNFWVDQETKPHTFRSGGYSSENTHVDFIITLPKFNTSIDSLKVWDNTKQLSADIFAGDSIDNLIKVSENNFKLFCTGQPIYVRVSGVEAFTHLEIQINLANESMYLEYPALTKSGDTSVLDAVGDVGILLSPKIINIEVNDIIVDLVNRRFWRVTDKTNYLDRNSNIQGWSVNARLVQRYEKFTFLPIRENRHNNVKTTRMNQFVRPRS